jgi:hypothetical protein
VNDLDELRQLRAEIPYPERSRLTPGRSRLLSAANQATRATTRPRYARGRRGTILLPAAAAATAAAAVIGYLVVPHGGPAASKPPSAAVKPTAPGKAAPVQSAGTHATLDARRVLDKASAVLARAAAAAEPDPGQWIYARTVDYEFGQGSTFSENWITFDGSQSAYNQDGQLIVHSSPATGATAGGPLAAFWANSTPKTAYDALASLPQDPQKLLTVIDKAAAKVGAENLAAGNPVGGLDATTPTGREWDYLTLLLWNAAGGVGAPPKAEAAAYQALALLPGVTVQQGIKDAAGVNAIAVSVDGGYSQLLLDPVSYQVLGLRQLSNGIDPIPAANPAALRKLPKAERLKVEQQVARERKSWPPKGTVQESLAYVHVAEVNGPGLK